MEFKDVFHVVAAVLVMSLLQPEAAKGLCAMAPVRDLGRVKPGVPVTQVFLVLNAGQNIVNLLELRPECDCLTGHASQTRLEPGGTAEILVTFVPPAQDGPVKKVLEVVTDAQGQPPTRLVLQADVWADIRLSGDQVTFLDVPRDGGGRAEILLEERGAGDLRITALQASAPYLTAVAVPQGRTVALQIRLDGGKLPANLNQGLDWVEVQAADPDPSQFLIQVRWTTRPLPAVAP